MPGARPGGDSGKLDHLFQNDYHVYMGRSGAVPAAGNLTGKGTLTRSRIVAAAAELMFEQGAAGTTMEDVRAAAGVSSSQIYHYFADKSALIRAVIEYQDERIVGGQEPMLARLDSVAGLRAWRDFLVEHQRQLQCRGGCPIGSLGSELAETDPRARAVVARGFGRWEAGIRGGYQAMHDRGELAAHRGRSVGHDGADDLVLALEVAVDGAGRESGAGDDHFHRDGLEAVLLEAGASCFEHLFAAGLASLIRDPRHASIVPQRKRTFTLDSGRLDPL